MNFRRWLFHKGVYCTCMSLKESLGVKSRMYDCELDTKLRLWQTFCCVLWQVYSHNSLQDDGNVCVVVVLVVEAVAIVLVCSSKRTAITDLFLIYD